MKNKYAEFDTAVLQNIEGGRNQLMLLDGAASGLRELAVPFMKGGTVPAWRIIDRRLQALRKKGEIHFSSGVWRFRP